MTQEELLQKSIDWFSEIEDLADRLSSFNVSYLSGTIKGKALCCKEFLQKHQNCNV